MIAGFLTFATSKLGMIVLGALAVLVAVAWIYLEGKHAGAATAAAAALAEAARRAAAANKARSEVKDTKEAMDADPFNRDNR